MSEACFEVKKSKDGGGVSEHHQQVHLHVKKCLAPKDNDELNDCKDIEEDAHYVDSLVYVLPFVGFLVIAIWNGNSDVF